MLPNLMLLIQDAATTGAPAAGGGASGGGSQIFGFIPIILCIVVFWFFMIRPEQKARKQHQLMLSELKKGDKVITKGGMIGSIAALQDDFVTLQADEGVRIKFERQAIRGRFDDTPVETKT